jgi:RNA polymerase sigma-70 factor (ECF subfamily)
MQPSSDRLSQISTRWTVFFQAHGAAGEVDEAAKAARRELLALYGGPVYRYLRAALRDADATDELYQQFALKFVRGDLRRARPDHGRFRDFLKTTLRHLVVDYHGSRQRQPRPLPAADLLATDPAEPDAAGPFERAWRERLLARAFDSLAAEEQVSGRPWWTVLRARTEFPDETAEQLASRLSAPLGKTVDAGWVRKQLHLARQRFAALLIDAVRQTLDVPSPDVVVQELIDLELYEYCRDYLPPAQ